MEHGLLLVLVGCGARSSLPGIDERGGEGAAGQGTADAGGSGGSGGEEVKSPCDEATEQPCGTDLGECSLGKQYCQPDGFFGPCMGDVGPVDEQCNALDDDCDGYIDNGFGLGQVCDGADSDLCLDDVMTCEGCTLGPDIVEICNGIDDNCNGEIDSDCAVGSCSPTLLVTGSVASSPGCVDFPVEAGSTGVINYPCQGGMVTATLGSIDFSGSVSNGNVDLFGTAQVVGPDNCLWQTDHFISGSIPAGKVSYFYQETLLTVPSDNCWSPCTETGTVEIDWL